MRRRRMEMIMITIIIKMSVLRRMIKMNPFF